MICRNCGAEYADELLKCPYCDAENVEASYRKQQDYVNNYKKKANFFATLPDLLVNRTGSVMKKTAILIGVVFLVILLLGFLGAYISSKTAVWRMEKEVAKLEEYYQAEDYEGLEDYFYSLDSTYGGNYEKYDRVVEIYWRLNSCMRYFEDWNDPNYLKYYTYSDLEKEFGSMIYLIVIMREMEVADYPYDEGEAIESFKGQLEAAIQEYVPMSQEEIEIAVERYQEDHDYNFADEVYVLYERLEGDTDYEMQ